MPATLKPYLPSTRLRIAAPKGNGKPAVDPKGGQYNAGLIEGFSAIQRGEALGHKLWIDSVMLSQVAALGNAARGIKSRFAHPGQSSDGMGTLLGRSKNFRVEGDKVLADLHFAKSSHGTPDGDLAEYVMQLARETPDLFGASIVFGSDYKAEKAFEAEHTDSKGRFTSPDPDNKHHLPHARVANLYAADLVDEPAANPDGLFAALSSKGSLGPEADALLLYALGCAEDEPEGFLLGIHPLRAREFVAGFLERHQFKIEKISMKQPASIVERVKQLCRLQKQAEAEFTAKGGRVNG